MDRVHFESFKDFCPVIAFLYEHGYVIEWSNIEQNGKRYWGLGIKKKNKYGDMEQVVGTLQETHCGAIQKAMESLGFCSEMETFKSRCLEVTDERMDSLFNQCLAVRWDVSM